MRKGHGSTKVPNVKLRPAPKKKPRSTPDEDGQNDDARQEPTETPCSEKKPFRGLVITASGITGKSAILARAAQLGAEVSPDLTDRVTHLIANGPGSAKYQHCVENRIPIMVPSWVTESYEAWTSGAKLDFKETAIKHLLPTFTSVRLCLTGFKDSDKMEHIQRVFSDNGGVYMDNLTGTTHLLCGGQRTQDCDERGWTELMCQAEKLNNKARVPVVRMVWEEWLWDCAEFGGLLIEDNYLVTKPRPERRTTKYPQQQEGYPSRVLPPSMPVLSLLNSTDPDESLEIKRLPESAARLWGGLLKSRGFEMKSGALVRSPTRTQSKRSSDELGSRSASPVNQKPLVERRTLSTFTRSKSFAVPESLPSTFPDEEDRPKQSSFLEIQTLPTTESQTTSLFSNPSLLISSTTMAQPNQGGARKRLFSSCKFFLLGDANSPNLQKELACCGGTIASVLNEDVTFVVVRLAGGNKYYTDTNYQRFRPKFRTECWLERCLFDERVCPPETHLTFVPLDIDTPVSTMKSLFVHTSGLEASERCWILRLVRALGGSTPDKFTRRITHLICPSGAGEKFKKAHEWGVDVVDMEWLYSIARQGSIPPATDFAVPEGGAAVPAVPSRGLPSSSMSDITNVCSDSIGFKSDKLVITRSQVTDSQELPDAHTVPTRHNTNLPSCSEVVAGPSRLGTSAPKLDLDPCTPNLMEFADDATLAQVPSSQTPSPTKLNPNSPVVSGERAAALKNTLTSLLGKRQASEEPTVKPRKKPPPRIRSKQDIYFSSPLPITDPLPPNSNSPFAADRCTTPVPEEYENMEITYEDPGQRDEKRKLMNLLGNDRPSGPVSVRKKTKTKQTTR